jgi:Tfp pilus assembly protein PilX
MRSLREDRGAMRLVTLTRLVVILGIIGVLGYDTFACMSTRVSTENDAQNAAFAASQAWHNTQNIDQAYQAAVTEVANNPGETVEQTGFTVDPDGTVHLILDRTAKTIVFAHIGFLKHWTAASEHGDSNSVN